MTFRFKKSNTNNNINTLIFSKDSSPDLDGNNNINNNINHNNDENNDKEGEGYKESIEIFCKMKNEKTADRKSKMLFLSIQSICSIIQRNLVNFDANSLFVF